MIQQKLAYPRRSAEACLQQLVDRRWGILDKPAASAKIEDGEGARDVKAPARRFLPPADVIHQQYICPEALGQDDRVVLASVQVRQSWVDREGSVVNFESNGASCGPRFYFWRGSLALEFREPGRRNGHVPYKACRNLPCSIGKANRTIQFPVGTRGFKNSRPARTS
jgi:hypothetical protein